MAKKVKIQQFHSSAKTAKAYINESLNNPHSTIARDYGGMSVVSASLSKSVGNQPNLPINGRRLFDITLTKRRKK